jgi:hypothetical protein
MPKAKLSQISSAWVDKGNTSKNKNPDEIKPDRIKVESSKRNLTLRLKSDTVKHLWIQRVKTGKTISSTIDELVKKYIPKDERFD